VGKAATIAMRCTTSRRSRRAGLGLLAASLLTGVAAVPVTSAAASSTTAVSEAKTINLMPSDLPSSVKWASTPQSNPNKVEVTAGKTAASCLQKVGAATDDAFGASGATGGDVLADVRSPQISDKANTFTQLPAANTEVVVTAQSKQATADLAAVAKSAGASCLATQYRVDAIQSGSGKVTVTSALGSAPHHGDGNGGVHLRLVATGGLLPQKLYNDEYFYVSGPVEVVFSFINLGSAFPTSWADQAITKVMGRAAAHSR
jgi:hypothetical protein